MESFDDALDAETVLWAVRGMKANHVSADDVARFLAKDTTLSVEYGNDDVAVVLDSLAAEGALEYEPTTGEWSIDATLAALDADASASPPDGTANAFLRLQLDEIARERDAIGEERDEWRRRAEVAEQNVSSEQLVADELRARVRELEELLEEERAAGDERSQGTRRAALALALAQHELDRLDADHSAPAGSSAPTRTSRPKRNFRGNWLD